MAHPPCVLSSSLSSLGVGRAAAAAASRVEHHGGGIFGAAAGRHRRRAAVALGRGRSVADKRLGKELVVSGSGRESAFASWSRSGGGGDVLGAAVGLATVMRRRKRTRILKTQAVSSDGGAVSPDGDKRREASGGGILGWLARQFTNQAKCVPLLRWPQYGFFNPKTWFNTVADSVVILLCLVAFVFVLAAADKLAIMIYRVLVPGAS